MSWCARLPRSRPLRSNPLAIDSHDCAEASSSLGSISLASRIVPMTNGSGAAEPEASAPEAASDTAESAPAGETAESEEAKPE